MSDPFASLDPIQKPKTAAERVLTSPVYNHLPPGAPVAAAPFGGGNMGGHMGGMGMDMSMGGMAPGMGMGMNMGPNMGMGMGSGHGSMGMMNMGGGMHPAMGGMNPGMGGMNPGMGQHQQNPFQQQQQQQQQPIMYDNIKNLLQQKPKAPAAFEDTASMHFLENLGGASSSSAFGSAKTNSGSFPASFSNPQVRAAEPTSAVADPFGGSGGFGVSPTAVSGDIGLSIFETGGGNTASPSSTSSSATSASAGGSKSSALADRLANGRRKTQEMQRSQLQLNANSFAHSGDSGVPKVSLKEMAGQGSSTSSSSKAGASSGNEMSLDDFSSGGGGSRAPAATKTSSGDFGGSDLFGGGGFSSTSAAPRQSSFSAQSEDSGPKPVDENDNTFW